VRAPQLRPGPGGPARAFKRACQPGQPRPRASGKHLSRALSGEDICDALLDAGGLSCPKGAAQFAERGTDFASIAQDDPERLMGI